MNCLCCGQGFYRDEVCRFNKCAHRELPVLAWDVDGKACEWGKGPTMPCPERPCPCPLGRPYREKLKQRAREQEKELRECSL